MYRKPEIMMTDIPVASPYYDRLRSLRMQLDFAPYGSPESERIRAEISIVERSARKRMEAERLMALK